MRAYKIVVKNGDKYLPVIRNTPIYRLGRRAYRNIYFLYDSLQKALCDLNYFNDIIGDSNICIIECIVPDDSVILRNALNNVVVCKTFKPVKELDY